MSKPEKPTQGYFERLFEHYLEVDKFIADGPSLKALGDNLRNYPLIVVFWAGIGLLWTKGQLVFSVAALLWGAWLAFFSVLTVIQSSFLVILVGVDLGKRVEGHNLREKNWFVYWLAVLSAFFFMTSILLAVALYGTLRK